jgi:inosine-uridine nucleoside N-ribohydrolase
VIPRSAECAPWEENVGPSDHPLKIHLDTDLGGDTDDLCALAMLLRWPGLEITGITTVAEQQGRRAGYVKYALGLAGRRDIPVAAGADGAWYTYRDAVGLPKETDYWPEPVPPSPNPFADALALLRHSIAAGATIVAIGPYTNLALFDQVFPVQLARVPIYLMGGHIRPAPAAFPQWRNEMDFNVQYDVASALHVFQQLRINIVPVEITGQTALRRTYLPALRSAGSLGPLLARQAEAFAQDERYESRYGQTCSGLPDDIINFQHDALACAVALGWDGVVIEQLPLWTELRDGWLQEHVDPVGRPVQVVTAVDGARFNAFWLDTVGGHWPRGSR